MTLASNSTSHLLPHLQRLRIDYVATDPATLLASQYVLAVFGFGDAAPRVEDPRYLHVPLQPYGSEIFEIWLSNAPVRSGRDGAITWASDGHLQFGAIEIEEHGMDIQEVAARAYAEITAFVSSSQTPHLLRIWNHLDAITLGNGDRERYRQFCVGRARGLGTYTTAQLPAATAVGRRDQERILQVYWLAATDPGIPLENPRQISAYHYPRQYGPQSPSFARAMLPPAGSAMPLLFSGTAAVVGHASMHTGQLLAQLEETLVNVQTLLGAACQQAPALPSQLGTDTRLKVYVREYEDLAKIAQALDTRFGDTVPRLLLHASLCRAELAVEIDGVHG